MGGNAIFGGRRFFVFWRYEIATTRAEAVKLKYGGNFSAVGGFSFLGGNDFGEGGKTEIWRFSPTRAVISRRENYRR